MKRVPVICDWLIRTFAADQTIREGDAVSWLAWESLLKENERLRRERNEWMKP